MCTLYGQIVTAIQMAGGRQNRGGGGGAGGISGRTVLIGVSVALLAIIYLFKVQAPNPDDPAAPLSLAATEQQLAYYCAEHPGTNTTTPPNRLRLTDC